MDLPAYWMDFGVFEMHYGCFDRNLGIFWCILVMLEGLYHVGKDGWKFLT